MSGWFDTLDGRSRSLVILGAVTGAMVLAAVWAVWASADDHQAEFTPRPFFRSLEAVLPAAARVEIRSADGALVIDQDGDGQWVLPEKGGYPVRVDRLRQLFQGLRSLEKVARKTANPAWHETLDLVSPDAGGAAMALSVSDDQERVLAAILLGKADDSTQASGRGLFHARRPDQEQTWLVNGRLRLETNASDWISTDAVALARDVVREVAVTPADGPAYVLSRDTAETEEFTLAPIPQGHAAASGYLLDSVAQALANPGISDVRPLSAFEAEAFATPAVLFRTFDGLTLSVALARDEEGAWMRLETSVLGAAAADPARLEAEREARQKARTLNEVADRFAFRIAAAKADQLVRPLSDLTRPLGGTQP